MKYNVVIKGFPYTMGEKTEDRRRLYALRQEAARNASEIIRKMKPEEVQGYHFVYYYELIRRDFRGNATGECDVWIYNAPYRCDDQTFYRFVDEFKPEYVGAYHK